ncbi:MAG: LysR family transcriptional regulator [Solirubrobacteraceae bacterium]
MLSRTRQVQYLVAVAEEGQMTAAAKRLGVAQPALSQAITQLENELAVKLVERHARGVRLTRDGAAFLLRARRALAAEADAIQTAGTLARESRTELLVGFAGAPPPLTAPELFEALSSEHPQARFTFRDLPFPCGPTHAWLSEVDVGIAHRPAAEDVVCVQPIRTELRAVIASSGHALSSQAHLEVAEVLNQTFIRYHPGVQADWAAFHYLDDHRGSAASHLTEHHIRTPLEMLGALSTSQGIAVAPYADATLAERAVSGLRAIPIRDADPASICLVWRRKHQHRLVSDIASSARALAGNGDGA